MEIEGRNYLGLIITLLCVSRAKVPKSRCYQSSIRLMSWMFLHHLSVQQIRGFSCQLVWYRYEKNVTKRRLSCLNCLHAKTLFVRKILHYDVWQIFTNFSVKVNSALIKLFAKNPFHMRSRCRIPENFRSWKCAYVACFDAIRMQVHLLLCSLFPH